ncbi:hypothetical protein H920_10959 [Fukomys damarensis]|uniref:Uncharacterized protein n=1 Tax=Fukomys damarensis TaxID=885580 RepID=A0A091DAY1_FUKDA|nr:hypothetical protein H920_10959 [Fukomys damarensis]
MEKYKGRFREESLGELKGKQLGSGEADKKLGEDGGNIVETMGWGMELEERNINVRAKGVPLATESQERTMSNGKAALKTRQMECVLKEQK